MGKAIAKVVYKPDSQSTDEYTVIVEPEEVCHFPVLGLISLIRYSCSTKSTKLEVSLSFDLA